MIEARMNKISVSQLSTLRWDLETDVDAYASHGFGGIGLYRPKVEEFGIERVSEMLLDYQIHPTSLSWVGPFTGGDLPTEEAILDAKQAILDAASLGIDTVVVIAGGRQGHIYNHLRNFFCEALTEVAAVASRYGVRLALEPFHPGCGSEWSFFSDLKATLDIIERVASPALGLNFDTYHVGMDRHTWDWLPDLAPYLHLVQLGDARHCPHGEMNRCLLGDGHVPVRKLMERISDLGYQGPWEIELLGQDVECLGYENILNHSRHYLSRDLAPF